MSIRLRLVFGNCTHVVLAKRCLANSHAEQVVARAYLEPVGDELAHGGDADDND